jgi:hypothetical protein
VPNIETPYPGIRTWKTRNGARVVELHYTADPQKGLGPKTFVPEINKHLSPWALKEYNSLTSKGTYLQEYEIDPNASSGARLFELNEAATCEPSFPIPHSWTRSMALDPHPRVPHAFLWVAVDPYGDRWYYREYWPSKVYGMAGNVPEDDNRYKIREYCEVVKWLESEENRENQGQAEEIYERVIDYAARSFGKGTFDNERPAREEDLNYQDRYKLESDAIDYRLTFKDAKKDRDVGIELVNTGLKPLQMEVNGKWVERSRIRIFADKCPELIWQLKNNRYPMLTATQAAVKDPISEPMQKRNHMTDLIRYLEMHKPQYVPKNLNIQSDYVPMHAGVNY